MIAQGMDDTRRFSGLPLVLSRSLGYHAGMYSALHGKKALVVGGTGGIGAAVSRLLIEEGARVTVIGRHPLAGADFLDYSLDNRDNCSIVCKQAEDSDILCVAWGPFLQKPIEETSGEEWESVVYANLTLPGALVSTALPRMIKNAWGRILLFGGTRTESVRCFRTNAAYGAAKTGISSLVKSVAGVHARSGVTCNALCPGFVATEYASEGLLAEIAAKNPDGVSMMPEDIAEIALAILKNPDINGVVLPVDKGWAP